MSAHCRPVRAAARRGRGLAGLPVGFLSSLLGGLLGGLFSGAPACAGPDPIPAPAAPAPAPPEFPAIPDPPDSLAALSTLWYARVFATESLNGAVIAADAAHVYLLAGTLRAYDLATGAVRWDTPNAIEGSGQPPVSDGALVTAASHTVAAFDARTGQRRWSVRPPAFAGYAAPALDARHVYIGTSGDRPADLRVLALDRATGVTRWSRPLTGLADGPGEVRGLLRVGNTLYVTASTCPPVGCHARHTDVLALDPESGRERWRVALRPTPGSEGADEGVQISESVVAVGPWLLAGDRTSNRVLAVDTVARAVVWTAVFDTRYIGATGPPVVDSAAGIVYAASGEGRVHALALATGAVRWRSPPAGGTIYWLVQCGRGLVGNAQAALAFALPGGALVAKAYAGDGERATLHPFVVRGRRVVFGTSLGLTAAACP